MGARGVRAPHASMGLGVLAASILLVVVATAPPLPPSGPGAPPLLPEAAVTSLSISGSVAVNGEPAANASGPASAIAVSFGTPIDVVVNWSARGGKFGTPSSVVVDYARTSILLLGFPAVSREVDERPPTPATGGSVGMVLDFTGSHELVEGLYRAQTVLVAANGTTLLAQTYYLRAVAPDHLTLLAVVLVLLAAFEVVEVAKIGRPGRRARRGTAQRRRRGSPRSGAVRGLGSGVVLGLVGVLGAQQLALVDLGPFPLGLEWLLGGAAAGAALLGSVGALLGRRRPPEPNPRAPAEPTGGSGETPAAPSDPDAPGAA